MLTCPSPADPTPSPTTVPSPLLSLLTQALSLLEQLLSMLQAPLDKENHNSNATEHTLQTSVQLTRCREIVTEGGDLSGFLLHGASITIGPQINQDPQAAIALFASNIQQELRNIKKQCKTVNTRRERQKEGNLDRKIDDCIKAVEGLFVAACQTETVKAAKSQNHSSKRSLLTEKIRKAQREESQSQLILQTIRGNPRVYGNIIEQTKVRDRTAPLNARNLDSLRKAERFSFSEIDSQSAQEAEQRGGQGSQSSRVLLSEMSEQPACGRERRGRAEVGCSRCEIY